MGTTRYETNKNRDDLQSYIKTNMDGDGYLIFKPREYAEETGIQKQTVVRIVKYLAEQGVIEYESMRRDGYLVHYLDIDKAPVKEKSNELKVAIAENNLPHRRCPKCGLSAPTRYAKFCWSCGSSLLTEKELLREEFRAAIGKIYRLITDSHAINEIMQTMAKVDNFAFKEEKEE